MSLKSKIAKGIIGLAEDAFGFAARGDAEKALAVKARAARPRAVAPRPLALPAPAKRLALPAPGPGLPAHAVKPRGGQWWADKNIIHGNTSPEAAAREGARDMGLKTMQWEAETPGDLRGYLNPKAAEPSAEQQWLERALLKYYKNDFGAPDDPLRSLAERGLHYDTEMTPDKWQAVVQSSISRDPIGDVLFPANRAGGMPGAGSDLRGETLTAMPWLAKQPVTDNVYGLYGGLDLGHFTDEFHNALNAEASGLPPELAVRPESLQRMTFPQAVEHVGKINQFRTKQMEQAKLSSLSSPAVRTFKEYPENNPLGLRWVELKAPELPQDYQPPGLTGYKTASGETRYRLAHPDGDEITGLSPEDVMRGYYPPEQKAQLAEALEYEGDTMGHCVGWYCDDVLSGRSRIFSLRDAKGEPHVTIGTEKGYVDQPHRLVPEDVQRQIDADLMARGTLNYGREYDRALRDWVAQNAALPENIAQIKGKQNLAPKENYLPFVQDFVKNGQWDHIGDFGNTGLVRLPDKRLITQQQLGEVSNTPAALDLFGDTENANKQLAQWNLNTYSPEDWESVKHLFDGFAVGGRVRANKGDCNAFAVTRKH